MNSFTYSRPVSPLPTKPDYCFRETFGVIDPLTKEKYRDVKRSFLLARKITIEDLYSCYLKEPSNQPDKKDIEYLLHLDDRTWFKVIREGSVNCIVSYQQRTTGNFAMARLFQVQEL